MPVLALFGLSVLMSFLASGIVAVLFIAPRLKPMRRENALLVLVAPHMFRFVGLSFLVPGVVTQSLSPGFAAPAAYGDLMAAILAMICIIALFARASVAIAIVWLFNLWGTGDLLLAFYHGLISPGINPATLGAAFYIPTALVPPLLITHVMIFWLLLRKRA
jgi:fucose 4-O-acetylase-like acetyltransferase